MVVSKNNKLKYMKKLYLFFIFIASSQIFGQTYISYTVDVDYWRNEASNCNSYDRYYATKNCNTNTYKWVLRNGTSFTLTESLTNPLANRIVKTISIPVYNTYDLTLQATCACSDINPPVPYIQCDAILTQKLLPNGVTFGANTTETFGIEKSIISGNYAIGPNSGICVGTVILQNFRPTGITIGKPGYDPNPNGVPTPLEVIAGQTVDLVATASVNTVNFPNVAYHWQYSLDNQATWIEVPNTIINGFPTNNSQTPRFTMENVLGADHINHFGTIHFSIGYGSRLFTNVITVNYSPGTLVLKDRKYFPPDCNADRVKNIVAYFDRDLKQNEILSTLQVIPYPKVNGDSPKFSQPDVNALVYDSETGWYKYTFDLSKGDNLENRYYVIEYQSQVNGVPRGTLAIGAPFLYEDPEPVKFEIKQALDPLCNNNSVEIAITVTGGTQSYKFYVDGIEKTPTPVKEADGYYHLRGLVPTATNNIKVTDSKDCIEKSS